jgi:Flp pilus assembly pilin Flp
MGRNATSHPKEVPMRTVTRLATILALAVLTLVSWQAAASAATAIEYGLIAALL